MPSKEELESVLHEVISVLMNENTEYRMYIDDKTPGYLLEFRDNTPVILVPDLHARNDFFVNVLNAHLNGKTVISRILDESLRVICLGDGMHAESRAKERWIQAYDEYIEGYITNDHLYQEMAESLSLMMRIMRLKIKKPSHFHFLKGNHENILNEEGEGNHPFSKFAMEGQLVKDFMLNVYGPYTTSLYARFEKLLPLFVIGKGFLASHAEPASFYSKKQLIQSGLNHSICEGLTWTANNSVSGDAVKKMLKKYQKDYPDALYFAGHRPVKNLFEFRAGGKFVQIHNPRLSNVVYLEPGEVFNPNKNILVIGEHYV